MKMIVAICLNRGIGFKNKLPWHIPEDLAFFKKTTLGQNIIMGRSTFDSLKSPLKDRFNFVLTRDTNKKSSFDNVRYINSPSEAPENSIIIGGEKIYKLFMDKVDTIYLTQIYKEYKCDTFFPDISNQFRIYSSSSIKYYKDVKFNFVTYKRVDHQLFI